LTQTQNKQQTDKVWTDDNTHHTRLLQESNLTARQLHRAPHHVII